MFMVFWMTQEEGGNGPVPKSQQFGSSEMKEALDFMEQLRAVQRATGRVGFVSMCSENPDSVTKLGVADAPADYNWKKRRI